MKNMYVGDSILRQQEQTMRAVEKGENCGGIQVLMLPLYEHDNLDMIDASYLVQPFYRRQELTVVGLAGDREEGERMILQMVQDGVTAGYGGELRRYLEDRLREEASE